MVAQFAADVMPVCVLVDGKLGAVFGFKDGIREEAPVVLNQLAKSGKKLTVLSGDTPEAVAQLGAALPLQTRIGGMLPEEKLHYVVSHNAEGILMAGRRSQ